MGKCIVSGSKIIDPMTGELNTIDTLVAQQSASLISINDAFEAVNARASEFVDDGLKPVFKVTTALGKSIETTITHPFLTGRGWLPLSEIAVDERIAVPRALPYFGNEQPQRAQGKAIAYMVTDGSTRNSTPQFTNENSAIVDDFISAMIAFDGISVNPVKAKNKAPSYRISAKSSTSVLCRERFAKCLNRAMAQLSISGKALAEILSLQPSTISQWRHAVALPEPSIYSRMCGLLGEEVFK